MKKYFLIVFVLLFLNCEQKKTATTTAKQDSIQKYLDLAENDTINYEKRIAYNDKAYSLIDLKVNDSVTRSNLNNVNIIYLKLNLYNLTKNSSEILIKKSIEANDSITLAGGNRTLGSYYMYNSNNEAALKHLFIAIKVYSKLNMDLEKIKTLKILSITQSFSNDFNGSINTSLKIINLIDGNGIDEKHKVGTFLNIANNLSCLKRENEALKYYLKCYSISNFDLGVIPETKYIINDNIISSYIETNNFIKAEALFYKYKFLEKTVDPSNIAVNRSVLGLYYLKKDNFKKAFMFLKISERLFKSSNAINGANYNQIYLSQYYTKVKDTAKAI